MWPFRRKERKKDSTVENVLIGLVIGGAIASIIGKKLLSDEEKPEDKDKKTPKE